MSTMVIDAYLPRASVWSGIILTLGLLLFLYIRENDRKLAKLPREALQASPVRWTEDAIHEAAVRVDHLGPNHPILNHLPDSTHRRYVVVGGAGLVGGWIVLHLIHRGEDPRHIRVLDLRAPSRSDLTTGPASLVDFVPCNISDAADTRRGFLKAWPDDTIASAPLTVFHTAANIRFYERHPALLPRSARVNVIGTQNVLDAAQLAGASVLVYTSSASVGVRSTRFLLWPWEMQPKHSVQMLSDDDPVEDMDHYDHFSNYAVTKLHAEQLVRQADRSVTNGVTLRTGVIRPGNGVYGPGGDILCGAFLVRRMNMTWISHVVENFCAVEVVSLSHLCYEQRLVELLDGSPNPDIGGKSFIVTDPGPPPTYGDVYTALSTLTNGETTFKPLSSTTMLLVAHVIETIYLLREILTMSSWRIARLMAVLFPHISGELVNLQPSLWNLTMPHLIFDGHRARLPAEQGGLGLQGGVTTLESLCLLVKAHQLSNRKTTPITVGLSVGPGLVSTGDKVIDSAEL